MIGSTNLNEGEKQMKYFKQFLIILFISFIGEALKMLLPLPIPASIYGMVLLFAGLVSGVIPLDSVKDAGKFLIEIMPVMFIPAGVGLMESWGILKPMMVPVIVITVVVYLMVMIISGHCTQFVIRHGKSEINCYEGTKEKLEKEEPVYEKVEVADYE